jgi:AcrR family transcriptional regulator
VSKGDRTKEKILNVGMKLWPDVTAREIGRQLEMTHANVAYHFGSQKELIKSIKKHAIEIGNSRVIAHLILTRDSSVKAMPVAERSKHMKSAT